MMAKYSVFLLNNVVISVKECVLLPMLIAIFDEKTEILFICGGF